MLDDAFLLEFKRQTEARWQAEQLDATLYGFQMQRGTRWNPGLTNAEIAGYEAALNLRFPDDLKRLLRVMNGTDLPTLNIYGSSGEPHRTSVGVYSYPRDLERVRQFISYVEPDRLEIAAELNGQGFVLPPTAQLMPIYSHRYVVCGDPAKSPVLSIMGTDAIVYGASLRSYLLTEFMGKP
jgi:hypothetical protein